MKIVFASCFDALEDSTQEVWSRTLEHKPDVLLLLGDSIYMDYFPHLGQSRKWDSQEFADKMYERYQAQWEVASFRKFINSVQHIGITWDDHDFAWNGSCGAGTGKKTGVPREKRLISKGLFLQFKNHLKLKPIQPTYPEKPSMSSLLNSGDSGIQETFDVGRIRIVMLDGRTFRQDQNDDRSSTMLGELQQNWLNLKVNEWNGVCLICSGSTLLGSNESWEKYSDYDWLIQQHRKPIDKHNFWRSIILSGDIHKNVFRRNREGNFYEITSSGAARPHLGGAVGNFGLLEILDQRIDVTLFKKLDIQEQKTINF